MDRNGDFWLHCLEYFSEFLLLHLVFVRHNLTLSSGKLVLIRKAEIRKMLIK